MALLTAVSCVSGQSPLSRAELERKVIELESANRALSESLLTANGELRELTDTYRSLRIEMEAFGIETVRNGSSGAGRRLMQAVNENLLLAGENEELRKSVVAMADAVLNLQANAEILDQKSAKMIDKALAGADAALDSTSSKSAGKSGKSLAQGGRIVSVKRDLGIAVIDLGTDQGVNIGMPFELTRNGKSVGAATVMDVRDHISGIYVHRFSAGTGKISVGDIAYLQTQPSR